MKIDKQNKNHNNRVGSGLIILVIGLIFLLRNFGIGIPGWIFSWHTILLFIGLIVGAKRNFNGGGWLIMVLIGGYFTLQDVVGLNLGRYNLAVGFIILGLFLILKPTRIGKKKNKDKTANFDFEAEPVIIDQSGDEGDDFVESVNIFGTSKQQVYSKTFKGGDVINIFGGCDLNLSQADFEKAVTIDIVALFGGVKIVIPPTWTVKSDVTAIFGGLDDKRKIIPAADSPEKIIRIKGVILFGGIEIKNF